MYTEVHWGCLMDTLLDVLYCMDPVASQKVQYNTLYYTVLYYRKQCTEQLKGLNSFATIAAESRKNKGNSQMWQFIDCRQLWQQIDCSQ